MCTLIRVVILYFITFCLFPRKFSPFCFSEAFRESLNIKCLFWTLSLSGSNHHWYVTGPHPQYWRNLAKLHKYYGWRHSADVSSPYVRNGELNRSLFSVYIYLSPWTATDGQVGFLHPVMSKIRPQTEIFRQRSKIRAGQSKQGEK